MGGVQHGSSTQNIMGLIVGIDILQPGGAKVPYAWLRRPGKYLKLVASWEGIPKLYFKIAHLPP